MKPGDYAMCIEDRIYSSASQQYRSTKMISLTKGKRYKILDTKWFQPGEMLFTGAGLHYLVQCNPGWHLWVFHTRFKHVTCPEHIVIL